MFMGFGEGATVAVMVMVEAGMVIVVVEVVVDAGGGGIVIVVGGIVIVVVEVQLDYVMIDDAVHCDLLEAAVVEVILGEVVMVVVGEALAEVASEVVDDVDKAQEQAELILEVDDMQSAKNVGTPVVTVTFDARYGVQNADAREGDAFKPRRHLSIILHWALSSLRKS
jgi:hypothetical protein